MDKTYTPDAIEQKLYTQWEQAGYFKPSGQGTPYSIMIPPPNVTGSLHMGHAFQHTLMDTLIRYKRMDGLNTLWQVGTDHAGIATQMVVERRLAAENKPTRHELGREAFMDEIWKWKAHSGGTITQQMRRLGDSVDWGRERFTMDEGLSKAVQEVFVRLHEDGLIYRGKRLVNWDPKLKTAISDLEVENKESKGSIWHLRYPLADGATTEDGKDYLIVATTRPETMLGDVCVAVNPKDARYQALVGQEIILPLVNRRIPIIADDYVDQEFGSGCVKITPAHDFNDYEVGKRNQMPMINVLSDEAFILETAEVYSHEGQLISDFDTSIPTEFQGLERFAARKAIVAAFDALGLLDKIAEHDNKVPYGDRSGVVIEPFLTDQWYVSVAPLAKQATEAVEQGQIQFVPKQYENMYYSWMRDIQDWCISRQLWWGHRIPAWYDEAGHVYVGRSEAEVREKYQLDDSLTLQQDPDVLDTWFSSALWTFSTLGWPDNTEDLKTFHPTDVLVTGFDIIFFWVARMIMMTMHFIKDEQGKPQVPFKTVYVTGLIRDDQGEKMSKSKGNVIDPLDMIDGIGLDALLEKRTESMMQSKLADKIKKQTRKEFPEGIQAHGTDALRFTLAALASTGRDINWDMNRLEGYRNFCNKIWNASRFTLMNLEPHFTGATSDAHTKQSSEAVLSLADQWILERFEQTLGQFRQALDQYRFDQAAQIAYDFTWHQFCDWYLELTKPILQQGSEAEKQGTRQTLVTVLEKLLRLLHPIMPYLTEEIWQRVAPLAGIDLAQNPSIMMQPFPQVQTELKAEYAQAATDMEWIKQLIVAVRTVRAEMNVSPSQPLQVLLRGADENIQARVLANQAFIQALARLESIGFLADNQEPPASATSLLGRVEVHIPMAGLIDKEAELARLDKNITKIESDIDKINAKLNNEGFVNRAPEQVIAQERTRLEEATASLTQLKTQREKVAAI